MQPPRRIGVPRPARALSSYAYRHFASAKTAAIPARRGCRPDSTRRCSPERPCRRVERSARVRSRTRYRRPRPRRRSRRRRTRRESAVTVPTRSHAASPAATARCARDTERPGRSARRCAASSGTAVCHHDRSRYADSGYRICRSDCTHDSISSASSCAGTRKRSRGVLSAADAGDRAALRAAARRR